MKEIPLRRKDGTLAGVVLVDDSDYAELGRFRWCLGTKGYAIRRDHGAVQSRTIRMHRQILGLADHDPRQCDHINGDKLDNRGDNLRIVTQAENMQNQGGGYAGSTSRHRGVYFKPGRKPTHKDYWVANCRINGVLHHLGHFATEDEAAAASRTFRLEHMPFTVEVPA